MLLCSYLIGSVYEDVLVHADLLYLLMPTCFYLTVQFWFQFSSLQFKMVFR